MKVYVTCVLLAIGWWNACTHHVVKGMVVDHRGGPSKNKSWYNKRRNQGIKVSRGKKPPQWEKEGDMLYQEIVQDNPYRTVNQKISVDQAEQLLAEKLQQKDTNEDELVDAFSETISLPEEPPFLWGGLPVGPVWKQRLIQSGYIRPTPIQVAAFSPMIQNQTNLILASPTGSGKSLAYLVPLLTTRPNGECSGRVWIITPTRELALQLQRVVSTFLSDPEDRPTIQVLGNAIVSNNDNHHANDNNNHIEDDEFPILSSLAGSKSYLLAGTPRTFRQLMDEMDQPIIVNKSLRQTAKDVMNHLEFLVFDEADRLFQTEEMARLYQERLQKRESTNKSDNIASTSPSFSSSRPKSSSSSSSQQKRFSTPLALQLLESISNRRRFDQRGSQYSKSYTTTTTSSNPSHRLRIICASATIGRTLRRQLMEALNSPSMDKAATLVTADVRTKKNADARKTSLLPSTLQHAYQVIDTTDKNDDSPQQFMAKVVTSLQCQLTPKPTLIFPGRMGVPVVQAELRAQFGSPHIYGIDDILGHAPNQKEYMDWKSTPIFVVSEMLGRGLDIPSLGYVFLLQVPSSAAGYTHLAGRTGRNGNLGMVVTFCRPKESPKLVRIGETLGLEGSFRNLAAKKSSND